MDKQLLITRLARAAAIAAFGFALAVSPLANPGTAAAKGDFYYDFEESVKPWVADGHGTDGYEVLDQARGDAVCDDLPVNHYAILRAGKAQNSLAESPEVPLPVGTWTQLSLGSAPGPHLVEITFYAKSEDGCEGCIPLVYAGGETPAHITQFGNTGGYLKAYWQAFSYKAIVDIPDGKNPALHAAIALDCVSIQFRPVP